MVWQKGWQILGSWQIRAQLAEICASARLASRLSRLRRLTPAPGIFTDFTRPLPSLRRRRKPPPPWGTSSCAGLHPRATPGHYIRSLFARPFAAGGSSASGPAEPPDLRRCKSFSCGRGGDALAAAAGAAAAARADEPQRRSCDVRGRSTLWALFHQDDRDRVCDGTAFATFPASSSTAAAALAVDVHPPPQAPCIPDDFLDEDIPVIMEPDEIVPVIEMMLADRARPR